MDRQPLIAPIECRTRFCNLIKAGDEKRLIKEILNVVWSFFNQEYNIRQPKNKKPFLDAIWRALLKDPLIVRDVLFTEEPYHYEWYNEVKDKKGKTTKIEVRIVKD